MCAIYYIDVYYGDVRYGNMGYIDLPYGDMYHVVFYGDMYYIVLSCEYMLSGQTLRLFGLWQFTLCRYVLFQFTL